MALRGTLKDFGIADILQLVGHQGKTGVLTVRNRDDEARIFVHNGGILRAECSTRREKELLGRMLVRAEAVTEAQLADALETQKRTLKRLGNILIEGGALDPETLQQFSRLQTTETVYRLFLWDSGTYEFAQKDVEVLEGTSAIRSENVLMEGFRQVDEWPAIRRNVTGYGMQFETLEDLNALLADRAPASTTDDGDDDLGLDDAFSELESGGQAKADPRLQNIGANEQVVFRLIGPERDVQKLIDLSRMGEFETCKALSNLLDAKIISPISQRHPKPSGSATVGGIVQERKGRWLATTVRALIYAGLLCGLLLGLRQLGRTPGGVWLGGIGSSHGYSNVSLKNNLSRGQMAKIRRAVNVFRAETGRLPESLSALVDVGLLTPSDLRFPWHGPYFFRVNGNDFELLRPIY